jgi:hypothetical protein
MGCGGIGGNRERPLAPARALSMHVLAGLTTHRDAVAEAVSSLELERSVFDSAETEILSAAFARAWAYVEFDPMFGMIDARERQSELARSLMAILKLGESNPISIANSAIALMRKNQSRILRQPIMRSLARDPANDRRAAATS